MLLTLLNMPDRVESSGAGGRQEDTARGSSTTKDEHPKSFAMTVRPFLAPRSPQEVNCISSVTMKTLILAA